MLLEHFSAFSFLFDSSLFNNTPTKMSEAESFHVDTSPQIDNSQDTSVEMVDAETSMSFEHKEVY